MTDKNLSSVSGNSLLPRLSPNLNHTANKASASATNVNVAVAVSASTPSTVLTLTGKFQVNHLSLSSLIAEIIGYKLTIDGAIIWDANGKSGITETLLDWDIQINESLLLEVTTTSDTSVTLTYRAIPIL